jgi:hypothetical protein
VLAHQYTSQLVQGKDTSVLDAILGNVGTTISFRVGTGDAELLAEAFAPRASPTDITGLPNHVAIVRSSGGLGNVPFTLRTSGPPPVTENRVAAIRQLASLVHGRDAGLVDLELSENLTSLRNLAPAVSDTRSRD